MTSSRPGGAEVLWAIIAAVAAVVTIYGLVLIGTGSSGNWLTPLAAAFTTAGALGALVSARRQRRKTAGAEASAQTPAQAGAASDVGTVREDGDD
jgi:peptidoglycan/LPS O-acetylase OafA/YrhL